MGIRRDLSLQLSSPVGATILQAYGYGTIMEIAEEIADRGNRRK
jgi:hypothetical protein